MSETLQAVNPGQAGSSQATDGQAAGTVATPAVTDKATHRLSRQASRQPSAPGSPILPDPSLRVGSTPAKVVRHHRIKPGQIVRYIVLWLVFLLLAGPFLWELSLAFKGPGDNVYGIPPYLIPRTPTVQNFVHAFQQVPILHYIGNTLIVAAMAVVGNIVLATLAGYAFGRLKWRGRTVLYAIFMGTIVIPMEGVIISQFLIVKSIGLANNLLGVVLPGLVGAVNIFLMTNAFKSIPKELEEAAQLDGANTWQQFIHVCVPQVKGTMTIIGIFSFIGAWNDFLWPLIVLSDENSYTLTIGLNRLKGMFVTDPRLVAAGALISLIPIVLFFAIFQRYFFRGLEEGGLKG